MAIDSIDSETLERVARATFGARSQIADSRAITPSKSHGITETPPSTRNLLFRVDMEGDACPYVFRFSRVEDDVYEQEVRNYELLAEGTGVRVPTIYGVDVSRELVPTSYMVMDYLPGKLWLYLAHSDNPRTDSADKKEISRLIGDFYRRVHDVHREANEPGAEVQTMLYSMDRLEEAARMGNMDLSVREVEACRRAIEDEPALRRTTLSLCLADTEIHVLKQGGSWEIAFVCDAEWVEFRHPYSDLAQLLGGARPWWHLEVPALDLDPHDVASMPFFRAYDPDHELDYGEMLRISCYYQLGLWAYVAMASRAPDKRSWIKHSKEPLIQRLVQIVSARALSPSPAG